MENSIFLNADFENADLRGAHLLSANLQGAVLRSNLQGAKLDVVNLQVAELWHAKLQGASLWYANLQVAELEGANLQGASLWHADLQGADLQAADLQGADLEFADLQGAYLNSVRIKCASGFDNATLNGIYYKYKTLDFETDADWDNLIKIEVIKTKIGNLRRTCDKFDNKTKDRIEGLFKANRNANEFIRVRKELACKDVQLAEKMLLQNIEIYDDNTNTEIDVNKAIIGYMKVNCTNIYDKLGNFYKK
ncbi:MAG: pentapeptide repeat-containing protein [Nitrospirae bacterium]|nr:pentapeptide repeat-containing protein [Nitrospirota bacterium]